MILTEDECFAALDDNITAVEETRACEEEWTVIVAMCRAIESAVIAKLAQGVDIPKPAIETTAFSRDSSTQHYYTADQLRTCIAAARVKAYAAAGASPVEPSQAPQGCACRWDAEDNRIATCTRHQGWLDVVQEWADRAKVAEAKQAQPPAPGEAAITYMTGYSDGREWAGATNQAQPEQPALSGCACRWDADDKRVATCVRHQGWLDVVSEWAERAKAAESQQAQPERAPLSQEQILHLADIHVGSTNSKYPLGESDWINFARAIEAAINAKEQLNG